MEKTLDELKAENAAGEVETETPPQEVEVETEPEVAEVEPEVTDEVAEPDPEETGKTEVEDWMQTDDEQGADKKFTDADIGAAKKKLRAKLESKHSSEVDELKAENERLRSRTTEPKQLNRPKREDFDNHDDPEEAYIDALTDFKFEQSGAKQATKAKEQEATKQHQAQQQLIDSNVDQHYERAVKLSEESGIAAEMYQSADKTIRMAIDAVVPGAGDIIADGLISSLGEGSEKVFYSLGVNGAKRDKLVSLLKEDPGGIKAAMYLGTLKSELTAPQRRKTNAPKPAAQVNGDSNALSEPHKALKKKYLDADKKGDTQARFDAKMAAKRAGANTSDW